MAGTLNNQMLFHKPGFWEWLHNEIMELLVFFMFLVLFLPLTALAGLGGSDVGGWVALILFLVAVVLSFIWSCFAYRMRPWYDKWGRRCQCYPERRIDFPDYELRAVEFPEHRFLQIDYFEHREGHPCRLIQSYLLRKPARRSTDTEKRPLCVDYSNFCSIAPWAIILDFRKDGWTVVKEIKNPKVQISDKLATAVC